MTLILNHFILDIPKPSEDLMTPNAPTTGILPNAEPLFQPQPVPQTTIGQSPMPQNSMVQPHQPKEQTTPSTTPLAPPKAINYQEILDTLPAWCRSDYKESMPQVYLHVIEACIK